MRDSTFFEKYELIADAPNAVAKMRELVLQLAVRGQLVPQDPEDGPAAELLGKLKEFKISNPLIGRSGRAKDVVFCTDCKVDGIPQNWAQTTIGEILHVIRGASPRPKGDPRYFSDIRTPYHWVKISDIRKHGRDGLLMDTDEFLTEAGMQKSVLLPKGTLVLTNSATIGIPIVLGTEGCCIHDGYLAFPKFPDDLLSQKFFLYLFHTMKDHAERSARGLAQLNLNTDLVRSFPFGLPPLAEQRRIVAKVDELMALCDRLEAQLQERETRHTALAQASLARFAEAPTPANLNYLFHDSYTIEPADLRKTILSLAVQGKLVPQDPNDEFVDHILFRILNDRRKHRRTTESNIRFLESENALDLSIPASWRWQVLDSLLIFGPTNGFSPKAVDYETPVRSLTLSATTSGYFKDQHTKFIVADIPNDSDLWLQRGDILVQRGNTIEYVGVSAVYWGEPNRFIYPDLMMKIRVSNEVDVRFIHLAMLSEPCRNYLRSRASGTSGSMPKINQGTLKSLPIPLPPIAEQHRIVAKVDQLMALVNQLEVQLTASREAATGLMDAIVAELTVKSYPISIPISPPLTTKPWRSSYMHC